MFTRIIHINRFFSLNYSINSKCLKKWKENEITFEQIESKVQRLIVS